MWNMIQCAVQGRGHIKSQTPCQDKTCTLYQNGTYVIALADGAGSAAMSHFGAEHVIKSMCEELVKNFDMYYAEEDGVAIKRKIISDLRDGLDKVAQIHSCSARDLASTLLVVAIKNGKYILVHVGDGVIGYLKNNELKIASKPENGEFANMTVFVTSADALQTMKLMKGQLGEIRGFALMSDGTEASFYNKKENTLAPALRKLMALSQLLDCTCLEEEVRRSFEDVVKKNTTDDCSLVLLVEEEYSFRGYNNLSVDEKKAILGYKAEELSAWNLRIFNKILKLLVCPCTLETLAKKMWARKTFINKFIEVLLEHNLIICDEGVYRTAVILEKEND